MSYCWFSDGLDVTGYNAGYNALHSHLSFLKTRNTQYIFLKYNTIHLKVYWAYIENLRLYIDIKG